MLEDSFRDLEKIRKDLEKFSGDTQRIATETIEDMVRVAKESIHETNKWAYRHGRRKFWMGFCLGISACAFFYSCMYNAGPKIFPILFKPAIQRIKPEEGYVQASQVEITAEDLNKSDRKPETYLLIEGKRFGLKHDEKKNPFLINYNENTEKTK